MSARVVVLYSWEGPHHQTWVERLVRALRVHGGVDARVDRFDDSASAGCSIVQQMEAWVRNSEFVVSVCTPRYKERFDNRLGGVGYEATIITGTIAGSLQTNSFIPVLRSGTPEQSIPSILLGRVWVDMRGRSIHLQEEPSWNLLLDAILRRRTLPPLGVPSAKTTRNVGDSFELEKRAVPPGDE